MTTLLENGASTWLSDTQNRTALHLAAENGRLTVVQRLVEFRAHLDAEDVHNKTPLVGTRLSCCAISTDGVCTPILLH